MKKLIFLCLIFLPRLVLAEEIAPSGKAAIPDPLPGKNLQSVVTISFNVIYGLAGLIAVIYLIIGGYQYMTSAGNPDLAETAKATIVNSIVGLIIIFVSYLLIRFVLEQLGVKGILS